MTHLPLGSFGLRVPISTSRHLVKGWPRPLHRTAEAIANTLSGSGLKKAPPTSIYEVNNGKILGFGADLGPEHPGFHDEDYKERRVMLSRLAKEHSIDDPIPYVEYTPEEVRVWGQVLMELRQLFPKRACSNFLETLPLLGFREDEVPQLQDMSQLLTGLSGWRIRPVAGLMSPREFLNGLAFKYFHSTQYMRHHSKPGYTPEPDVCHELIGHIPMLANPAFSQLIHEIGVASLMLSRVPFCWKAVYRSC
jgi:hypothetical protein